MICVIGCVRHHLPDTLQPFDQAARLRAISSKCDPEKSSTRKGNDWYFGPPLVVCEQTTDGQRKTYIGVDINRLIANVRARVEHPFQVLKRQVGYIKTRYRGLAKNRAQLFSLFALGNLYCDRRRLMA